jgi:hypothetical protein
VAGRNISHYNKQHLTNNKTMKKRESFCTTERCNVLFAALTEFHRLSSRCERDQLLPEGTFDKCLKNAKADSKFKNYKKFIKEELVSRKLIKADFTEWNSQMSEPTYAMAKSVIDDAVKRLSKYNQDHKSKETKAEEPVYPLGKKEVKKKVLLSEATQEQLTDALRKFIPKGTSYTIHNI